MNSGKIMLKVYVRFRVSFLVVELESIERVMMLVSMGV